MAREGDVLKLQADQALTVVTAAADSGGELLEFDATWGPGTNKPFVHFHPSQDERFEVLEGELTVELDGETRTLAPGDVVAVPRGAVHSMWNAGEVGARARWQVRPALRTEELFEKIDAVQAAVAAGEPPPPGADAILETFAAELRLPA